MKNSISAMNPRQKKTLFNLISEGIREGKKYKEIEKKASEKLRSFGIVSDDEGTHDAVSAVLRSFYVMEYAIAKEVPAKKLILSYIRFKLKISREFNDFGAFGDLLEVCIRFASKPENLFTYADLHLTPINETDITLRGIPFEIGHNGKTFAESTYENPMNGHYKMIAYGMIAKSEKRETLERLAKSGDVRGFCDELCKMLYVFDKSVFVGFINNISRGGGIKWKSNLARYQVIYNDSKYKAFIRAIENSDFPTLYDWLKNTKK